MNPPPLWAYLLVSAVTPMVCAALALVVSLRVANRQSKSAVQAALQQSLDTERTKLVYKSVERHTDKYHQWADRLEAVVMEAPKSAKAAEEFCNGFPQVIYIVHGAAYRVAGADHREVVERIQYVVHEHYEGLYRALAGLRAAPDPYASSQRSVASHHAGELVSALNDLTMAVDAAAEARLYAERPSDYRARLIETADRCVANSKPTPE